MGARDSRTGAGENAMTNTQRYLLWGIAGWLIGMALLSEVIGADLAVPKRQIEHCLENNGKSFAGQVLQADKTCKSGMRWMNSK